MLKNIEIAYKSKNVQNIKKEWIIKPLIFIEVPKDKHFSSITSGSGGVGTTIESRIRKTNMTSNHSTSDLQILHHTLSSP